VPVGTQVFDDEGSCSPTSRTRRACVVARGGAAGRGNKRFATPTRQTPRFAETGLPGEELCARAAAEAARRRGARRFSERGQVVAARRISNAKPKVADYPFTTLAPVLGRSIARGRQLTVADVPGLIEGASEGVGSGTSSSRTSSGRACSCT
jgi:GTP-binding protein